MAEAAVTAGRKMQGLQGHSQVRARCNACRSCQLSAEQTAGQVASANSRLRGYTLSSTESGTIQQEARQRKGESSRQVQAPAAKGRQGTSNEQVPKQAWRKGAQRRNRQRRPAAETLQELQSTTHYGKQAASAQLSKLHDSAPLSDAAWQRT